MSDVKGWSFRGELVFSFKQVWEMSHVEASIAGHCEGVGLGPWDRIGKGYREHSFLGL